MDRKAHMAESELRSLVYSDDKINHSPEHIANVDEMRQFRPGAFGVVDDH